MRQGELRGLAFRCLEGCGFCCTFQPEASRRELAALRARLAPRPLSIVTDGGRTYLGLQSGCGACTLLQRRECQAYDARPAHCRYFPFHVHFAEEPEVYVNYTCRGVERVAGGDLDAAFRASVLDHAPPGEFEQHVQLAREAYCEFKRRARRAGAWGDADATAAAALTQGEALFTGEGLRALVAAAGGEETPDEILAGALEPFGEGEVARRPFYLPADLRWLTFARDGDAALDVLEMDETGALSPAGRVDDLKGWRDVEPDVARGLVDYLRRLVARRVFAGSVYALVDDRDYETTVEQATRERLAEIVGDLALRARILRAMGVPDERLADEVARFYDSTFLDAPAIGGYL